MFCYSGQSVPNPYLPKATSLMRFLGHSNSSISRNYHQMRLIPKLSREDPALNTLLLPISLSSGSREIVLKFLHARRFSSPSIELNTEKGVVRFRFGQEIGKRGGQTQVKRVVKKFKMSKKAKLNELRFYRLKAKKKMRSPNPEVRIRYKLEKVRSIMADDIYVEDMLNIILSLCIVIVQFKLPSISVVLIYLCE